MQQRHTKNTSVNKFKRHVHECHKSMHAHKNGGCK